MIKQIKRHWQTFVMIVAAGVILVLEYQAVSDFVRWAPVSVQNPFFVAMGKWGIRFLLISLAITPLYSFTGWRFPIKLRKPAGLIAFGFVAIHAGIHIFHKVKYTEPQQMLDKLIQPSFVIYGVIAFFILALMAITSFKPMMKLAGRYWKPLHRCVYAAGTLMMIHGLLATTSGKRAFAGGEESAWELQIYLLILATLLIVRVPIVKNWLKYNIPFAPNPRKRKMKPKRTFDDAVA